MGVGGDLGKFIQSEVLGLGAGGELLEAQVDSVGPEVQGGERGVGTGRSELP